MKKGSHMTEKTRKKISVANTGKHPTEETRKKISEAARIRMKNPEARQKIREALLGFKHTDETKRKLREVRQKQFSNPENRKKCGVPLGFKRSEETRRKMSEARKGTHPTTETRKKQSAWQSGEKSRNWQGGISFEPYCPKFNEEFKNRVREYFDCICPECLTPQNGTKLHVHHINFNKMSCCDNTPPLFVPLCQSCHSKTGGNRPYWEAYFTHMIEGYYQGKCYFTPEEMACRG